MMELKEGMSVFTPNGQQIVGKINHFVLDPVTKEITHLVIQKGGLFSEDKVLPFEMVTAAGDKLALKADSGNLDQLPSFEERYFVRAGEEDISAAARPALQSDSTYYYYPVFEQEHPVERSVLTQLKRNIPEDEILLNEGANVMSSDEKHVGDVERLLVDPQSNRPTHFLISQGLLFKDRKLVPTDWIKSLEEDKVHLAVSSQVLERLPSYKS